MRHEFGNNFSFAVKLIIFNHIVSEQQFADLKIFEQTCQKRGTHFKTHLLQVIYFNSYYYNFETQLILGSVDRRTPGHYCTGSLTECAATPTVQSSSPYKRTSRRQSSKSFQSKRRRKNVV